MGSKEILALIPARGGSKSILRKNLVKINGKPLVGYSIEHALATQSVTRVIVSTDDDEIAEVAKSYGAEVPFMRPAEYAQDLSTDFEVFRHALQWLLEHENYLPELVVHLRPTGPVRQIATIEKAIALIQSHPEADSLRSVSHPAQTPFKMWRIENGYLQALVSVEGLTESYCQPRQVLPEVFWHNGYIDIVRPRAILEMGLMCGRTILPFVTDEPILDIDYPEAIPEVEEALRKLQLGETIGSDPRAKQHPV